METERTEKVRGKNGGSRPGSGRKSSIAKIADEKLKLMLAEKWLDLHQRLGLPYLESVFSPKEQASHEIKMRAAQEIANRAEGKPKEAFDVTSKGKQLGAAIIKIVQSDARPDIPS